MEMHEGPSSSGGRGGTEDDGSCKLQLNTYAKLDARLPEKHGGCTPVMVSITGPSGSTKQRAPIDVVLVLHVHIRCKAPAKWHSLLNEATQHLVDRLGQDDRLAIVPALLKETRIIFEDAVVVPVKPKLTVMSSENKVAAYNSVCSSEAMRSNTQLVRDLESAEEILFGRESNVKEERAGHIIVISNSDEDMSSMLRWRFRCVHAFGFRDAGNARTMYTIGSSSRESTYAVLDDVGGNKISPVFTETINRITSASVPVEVKLRCKKEVVLSAVLAPRVNYFISHDKKVGIIWANASANAHRAGGAGRPTTTTTTTNCILYLDIPDDYHESEYGDLLNIQVKYGHRNNLVKLEGPRLVTVRKGMSGSTEVAAEMVRVEAVKIISDIALEAKNNDHGQLYAAADKLHKQWIQHVKKSDYGVEADNANLLSELAAEMREMEERLRQNNFWLEYMLSWRSRQWWPLPPLKQAGSNTTALSRIIQGDSTEISRDETPEQGEEPKPVDEVVGGVLFEYNPSNKFLENEGIYSPRSSQPANTNTSSARITELEGIVQEQALQIENARRNEQELRGTISSYREEIMELKKQVDEAKSTNKRNEELAAFS